MYSVYFLESLKNKRIYTGVTEKNPKERLLEHNSKSNKWTKENGPFELVYYEEYVCKQDALHRENFYKSGFGRKIRDAIIKVLKN